MINGLLKHIKNAKVWAILIVLLITLQIFLGVKMFTPSNTDTYTVNGSIAYVDDAAWSSVTRPKTFDWESKFKLVLYNGETEICTADLQDTNNNGDYHFAFYDDGQGAGTYTISNVPKTIDGESVDKVQVKVVGLEHYKDVDIVKNSSDANADVFAMGALNMQLITTKLEIEKKVLGTNDADTTSFKMDVKVSKGGIDRTNTVYVQSTSNGLINVPIGVKCTVTETTPDSYSLIGYKVWRKNGDGTTMQISSTNTFDVSNVSDGFKMVVTNAIKKDKLEFIVEWIDNHSTSRSEANFKLMCKIGDAGQFKDIKDVYTQLGLQAVPVLKEDNSYSKNADIQKYYYEKLPTTTTSGELVEYKIEETVAGYIVEETTDANEGITKFYNMSRVDFKVKMLWLDNNSEDVRPSVDQIKNNLKLYRYTSDDFEEVSLNKSSDIKITPSADNSYWDVAITKPLPQYAKNNNKHTYVLVEGSIDSDGNVTQNNVPLNSSYDGLDTYELSYYNGQTSFGNIFDKCYNNQNIIHTLRSNFEFSATKVWKDDGETKRPESKVTLWRFPIVDESNMTIDFASSARAIGKNEQGEDIVLTYKLKSSGVKGSDTVDGKQVGNTEVIKFDSTTVSGLSSDFKLPKYDDEGRLYCYFVIETMVTESSTALYKISYLNADGSNGSGCVTQGGTITSVRYGREVICIYLEWMAASSLSEIEGKVVEFEIYGKRKNAGNDVEKVTILDDSKAEVSGFVEGKKANSVEVLVNPYDEEGIRYGEFIIKQTKISAVDNLVHDEEDERKVNFNIGESEYEGISSAESEEGESLKYGVKSYTYKVKNYNITRKIFALAKVWMPNTTIKDLEFDLYGVSINANKASSQLDEEDKKCTIKFDKETNKVTIQYTDDTVKVLDFQVETFTAINQTEWTLENIPDLPKFDREGYEMVYKAKEITEPNGAWSYTAYEYTDDKSTITNRNDGGGDKKITAEKVWKDDGDIENRYPVKVTAYDENGEQVGEPVILNSDNLWIKDIVVPGKYDVNKCTLKEELIYTDEDGNETLCSEEEENGELIVKIDDTSYKVEHSGTGDNRVITNTRYEKMDVILKKVWIDGKNEQSIRPSKVSFQLYRNDEVFGTPIELSSADKTADSDDIWEQKIEVDRFDENGKLYVYTLKEIPNLGSDYKATLETEEGKDSGKKYTKFTFTNKLQGSIDFTVYIRWLDKATGGKNRPDIYLSVYQYVKKNGVAKSEVIKEEGNQVWENGTIDANGDGYDWKITVSKLQKYDSEGYKYTYFAKEELNNHGSATGMKYLKNYHDDTYKGPLLESIYKDDIGPDKESQAYDEDYIVNTLYDTMTVEGEKIWKNTTGFKLDELPVPGIELYRRKASEPANAAVKVDSDVEGNPQTNFYFTKENVTVDGNYSKVDLPKYSDEGELYIYSLEETLEHVQTIEAGYPLYTITFPNNSIANEFDTTDNNRSIKVTKSWEGRDVNAPTNEKQYPAVNYELYRYEVGEFDNKILVDSKTIDPSVWSSSTTTYDVIFDNLLIYSPKGKRYNYYVKEADIKSYETEFNTATDCIVDTDKKGIRIEDTVLMSSANKTTSVSVVNTYVPNKDIKIIGKKVWNDYNNKYGFRPDSIALTLWRYTNNEGVYTNRVADVEVTPIQETESSNDVYIKWDKSTEANIWNYTIYNLPEYAANGQEYIYYVTEQSDATGYYDTTLKRGNQVSKDVNKTITMYDITNGFAGKATAIKRWIDGSNKYGFRPKEITMTLYGSKDSGVTWEEFKDPTDDSKAITMTLSEANVVDNTNGNTWSNTYTNLPKYYEDESGNRQEWQYKWVETKIGEVNVNSDKKAGVYTVKELKQSGANGLYTTEIQNSMFTTKLEVTKEWNDSNNSYKARPTELKFNLKQKYFDSSGNAITTDIPGIEKNWTNAQDIDGNDIIITMTSANVSTTDTNKWEMTLTSLPGKIVNGQEEYQIRYQLVECTDNSGTYKYPQVDSIVYKNYNDITNYADDHITSNADGTWAYDAVNETNSVIIRNQLITNEVANTKEAKNKVTTVEGKKTWRKDASAEIFDITVKLQQEVDSQVTDTGLTDVINKDVEADVVSWSDMPAYTKDGKDITYKLAEVMPDAQKQKYVLGAVSEIADTANKKTTYVFTNIQLQDYVVEKTWEDNNTGLLPSTLTQFKSEFQLQESSDGSTWDNVDGKTCVINCNKGVDLGTYTFTLLPRYTLNGDRIYYRVQETKINDIDLVDNKAYTSANNDDSYVDDDKTYINNTLVTIPLSIQKVWNDRSNASNLRPNDITIKIQADFDKENEYKDVDSSLYSLNWITKTGNTWEATVEGLPKYGYTVNGSTVTSRLIKYKVIEVDRGDRYFISENNQQSFEDVTLLDSATKYDYSITNTLNLQIKTKKTDETSGAPLSGVMFELQKYNDLTLQYETKQTNLTTDANGDIEFEIAVSGKYKLVEKSTVIGYELELNGKPFECEFTIEDSDFARTIVINKDNTVVLEDNSNPEIEFIVTSQWKNMMKDSGLSNKRILGTLEFEKKDGETQEGLDAVVFKLYKKNGASYDELGQFNTGKKYVYDGSVLNAGEDIEGEGHTVVSELPWGEYKLVETITSEGYVQTSKEYTFTIDANIVNAQKANANTLLQLKLGAENVTDNVIYNNKNVLSFIKKSSDGNNLSGGIYKIWKVDGSGNKEAISVKTENKVDAQAKDVITAYDTLYGIPAGNYEIQEINAPYGYSVTNTRVKFTVDAEGIAKDEKGQAYVNNQIVMVNEPIVISITKTDDLDNGIGLPNAQFKVTGIMATNGTKDSSESEITINTGTNGAAHIEGRLIQTDVSKEDTVYVYKLKEINPPAGFVVEETEVYFTLDKNGAVTLTDKDGNPSNQDDYKFACVNSSLGRVAIASNILFVNDKEQCTVNVTKKFENDYGVDINGKNFDWRKTIRPTSVKLQLYEKVEGDISAPTKVEGKYCVIDTNVDKDTYEYQFKNLPSHRMVEVSSGNYEYKRILYSAVEEDVAPYYNAIYDVKDAANNKDFDVTVTNTAIDSTPVGTLQIKKINKNGNMADAFKVQVKIKNNNVAIDYMDTYTLYDANGQATTQSIKDGCVEIKGDEYAEIYLPKGVQYEIKELDYKIDDYIVYIPTYDNNKTGVIEEGEVITTTIINNVNCFTGIENITENNSDKNREESQTPKNAGGMVGTIIDDTVDNSVYDKVDYKENVLGVYWKPIDGWNVAPEFIVTYETIKGDSGKIIVKDYLDENGKPKLKTDDCYKELANMYPNFDITMNDKGATILYLDTNVENLSYLNKVDVLFVPTIAVINTTDGQVGGQVKVENGEYREKSDGKGVYGEERYEEKKVYGDAAADYVVDLDNITVSNVVSNNTNVTAKKVEFEKDGSFSVTLPYEMAGVIDDYTMKGKLSVTQKDDKGMPLEVDITFEEVSIPIDVGIPFAAVETSKQETIIEDTTEDDIKADITKDVDTSDNMNLTKWIMYAVSSGILLVVMFVARILYRRKYIVKGREV